MASHLALMRHAQARRDDSAPGSGALTPDGEKQARDAGRFLEPLDVTRLLASGAPRAVETARLLGLVDAMDEDPRLAGLRVAWEDDQPLTGLDALTAPYRDPEARPHGGESLVELLGRAAPALTELAAGAGNAVAVSHRFVNTVLLADVLGLDLRLADTLQQDPGCVNLLQRRESGLRAVAVNVVPGDPLRTADDGTQLPDTDAQVERRLFLVRHGEAENFLHDGRMGGRGPHPLTARGREQAQALGRAFTASDAERVHCSDVLRAHETAKLLAGARDVVNARGLRELSLGNFDGASVRALFAACPGFMTDPDAALPGGETPREGTDRVVAAAEEALSGEDTRDVVLVAHGGTARLAAGGLLGWPLKVAMGLRTDWASVIVLDRVGGRWLLRCLNWTPEGAAELTHARPIEGLSDEQGRLVGR